MTEQRIKVWDIFVRMFHWSLVLMFTIAYLTEEELLSLHLIAGYAVSGLLVLRLMWGFVGSRHARFSDFVYRPAEVKRFVRDTMQLRARRYVGHNPAGGAMILLMLASLVLLSASGMAVYGIEESAGPLAMLGGSYGRFEEVAEGVHEFFANFTLLLVVIHVAGVMVESAIHRENLAKSMVTGFKRADTDPV
ncbi:MAG: cytochrome b/b6 domain-containing protein [Gammaproteobacteria bacterium]|jgi:cytochrome b